MSKLNIARRACSSRRIPFRWVGGILVLLLCFTAYLDRIALSVTASPLMESLSITPVQLGMATSLFSIGYFTFQMPAAALLQRFGSRSVLAVSLALWSVFTAATGLVGGLASFAFVRGLFGVAESPVFTGGNQFFSNWFKRAERGRANSLMNAGAFAANIFGPPLVVGIVSGFGWRSVYFVFSVIGVVLAAVWYVTVRTRPSEHPRISREELAEICADAAADSSAEGRMTSSWRALMSQRSFWALALGYFATLWCVQFFIYWLPYYLQVTRNVSFRSLGIYASLPWFSIVAAVLAAGVASDFLLARGCSRFVARNVLCSSGLAVGALSLVASTTASTVISNILWISLALGMAGVAQTLSWTIVSDIGGRANSILGSWMNMWGFIAASIVPTVAPVVGKLYGWNAVIFLNAFVTILGVAAYLLVVSHRDLKIEVAELA
ncbi:MFS transporter [Burkholderia cenocepacia]|uniref:MFS transporter n=1 Tax=Burkholderia cenocepacia TaxID=95486 RepID=UPI000F5637F3|nr:MFS transporter [Burkholderia cenocepacia]RQU32775.1 MFS transporter [Burkholderia cenocepacia]RQU56988.1 MFS transporter [Burkholderia cenocepacia]